MAEGVRVVGEALRADARLEGLYVSPTDRRAHGVDDLIERALGRGVSVWELAPGVLERLSDTVTPQGVLAVVGFLDVELAALRSASLLVVAAGVRDPGNAGTIMRAALAAGAEGIVCCGTAVDPYNPKTVRASAGALFHLPIVVGGETDRVLEVMGSWGVNRFAAEPTGGTDYALADLASPAAFVMGNEAHGLDPSLEPLLDGKVTIPLSAGSESLNVAMAAAILCFEAARQRRFGRGGNDRVVDQISGPGASC